MNILFISKYNQFRSKIAEAFFNKINKLKGFSAKSAGIISGLATTTTVLEVAKKYKLSLRTSQSTLSANLLEKHELIILVGEDVPVEIFSNQNPYVNALACWQIPSVDENNPVAVERVFRDIEKRVEKLFIELGQEKKKLDELDRIIIDLTEMKDEKTIDVWRQMGLDTKNYLGVNPLKLKNYSRHYKNRHKLALALWRTNIHDARVLATLVEDPREVSENQIETWIRQADFWDITDKIASELIVKTDFGSRKIKPWLREKSENFRRTGWVLVEYYARRSELTNEDFLHYLQEIKKNFVRETMLVQEAMVYALISVGKRNYNLHQVAFEISKNIGHLSIIYGQVDCGKVNPFKELEKIRFT